MLNLDTTKSLKSASLLAGLLLAASTVSVLAADVTGSWRLSGPAQSGMVLKTRQQGAAVRFQLEIYRGSPTYNSGWIGGTFELVGPLGVFRTDDTAPCEISFRFEGDWVQIKESETRNDCDFGNGVHATGTLQRKSSKPPKFSATDPRAGRN